MSLFSHMQKAGYLMMPLICSRYLSEVPWKDNYDSCVYPYCINLCREIDNELHDEKTRFLHMHKHRP